jgi:hypothetical protein
MLYYLRELLLHLVRAGKLVLRALDLHVRTALDRAFALVLDLARLLARETLALALDICPGLTLARARAIAKARQGCRRRV